MSDNPLSKELIDELNALSQLQGDEQKTKLQEFMKKLNPEQLQYLKQTSCLFCGIVHGSVPTNKIYEDDMIIAVLDINPAAPGHTLIIPKKHYFVTGQMTDDEVGHLFVVANAVSKAIFDELKPGGTNIFIANGYDAGQHLDHVVVHVIPRYKDDDVSFSWKNKQVEKKDLDELTERLKGKTNIQPKLPLVEGPSVPPPQIHDGEEPQEATKEHSETRTP